MSNKPIVIQVTLDQLMLGVGIVMFVTIIWQMSEHPIWVLLITAAIVLIGCLGVRGMGIV